MTWIPKPLDEGTARLMYSWDQAYLRANAEERGRMIHDLQNCTYDFGKRQARDENAECQPIPGDVQRTGTKITFREFL